MIWSGDVVAGGMAMIHLFTTKIRTQTGVPGLLVALLALAVQVIAMATHRRHRHRRHWLCSFRSRLWLCVSVPSIQHPTARWIAVCSGIHQRKVQTSIHNCREQAREHTYKGHRD